MIRRGFSLGLVVGLLLFGGGAAAKTEREAPSRPREQSPRPPALPGGEAAVVVRVRPVWVLRRVVEAVDEEDLNARSARVLARVEEALTAAEALGRLGEPAAVPALEAALERLKAQKESWQGAVKVVQRALRTLRAKKPGAGEGGMEQ